MTKPPERIDPDTLVTPLMNVTGPLPEGTPLYDSKGYLVATIGKVIQSGGEDYQFKVPLVPPTAG